MQVLIGILYHSLGGIASGSFYMPFNKVKGWAWESYWIIGGLFSWLIVPPLAAWMTVPGFADIIGAASSQILLFTFTGDCGRLTKCVAENNLANHGLNRPAGIDKTASQIVQQLRVARRIAQIPEIVDRSHNTAAHQVVPNPVDHDSCCQGVFWIGDQLGHHR